MEWNQGDVNLRVSRWAGDFKEDAPREPYYLSYMPNLPPEHRAAERYGHGGGDYFTSYWFKHAIVTGERPLIDVYRAVDMSMIGIQGYRSALNHSTSYEIPDLHAPAKREQYRHDDWNPDPARPCADKPFPSVSGHLTPTPQAREEWHRIRAKYEEEVRREAEGKPEESR